MSDSLVLRTTGADAPDTSPPSQPCVMLIFGASGDLTKRLLVPALYNLACDNLLSENFALLGTAMDELTSDAFREHMSTDIKKFHTRQAFDEKVWDKLVSRFHYLPGGFSDMGVYEKLKAEVKRLDLLHGAQGNVLFYFATAPKFFGMICDNLHASGFKDGDMVFLEQVILALRPEQVAAGELVIKQGDIGPGSFSFRPGVA